MVTDFWTFDLFGYILKCQQKREIGLRPPFWFLLFDALQKDIYTTNTFFFNVRREEKIQSTLSSLLVKVMCTV